MSVKTKLLLIIGTVLALLLLLLLVVVYGKLLHDKEILKGENSGLIDKNEELKQDKSNLISQYSLVIEENEKLTAENKRLQAEAKNCTPFEDKKPPIKFCENEIISVEPNHQKESIINLTEPLTLEIKMVELNGRNIECKLSQNGKIVYASGINEGKIESNVPLGPGKYALLVTNDDSKKGIVVKITVMAHP